MKVFSFLVCSAVGLKDQRHARDTAFPCPSRECWNFDETSQTCSVKDRKKCITLYCAFDSFNLEFGASFFGITDGDVSAFDPKFNTQFTNGKFQINCPLGECGMSASINDDGSQLTYSMQVETTKIQPIHLQDQGVALTLYNSATSATLDASCEYATSVSISSNSFDVQSASADADLHQRGDLSSGFKLNLYSDASLGDQIGTTIFIGQRIWAQVEWEVASAQSQVNYYLNNCEVELEATPPVVASIIEENCYSSTLGITKIGSNTKWIVKDNSGFTFTSFSSNGDHVTSQTVTVRCDIKLCLLSNNKCAINTEVSQCPRVGSGYKFTPNGCTDGYNSQGDGTCTEPTLEAVPNVVDEPSQKFAGFPPAGIPPVGISPFLLTLVDEEALTAPENLHRTGFSCDNNSGETLCTLTLSDGSSFIGVDRDGVVDFRGIPYAIAPLEQLRWTQPLIRFNFKGETHDGRNYQKTCATHHNDPDTDEDCLGVNISIPRDALDEGRAIPMVYNIHGGDYNHGNNRGRPANLLKLEQVAWFSIAYRFGIYGFLTLPEVEEGQEYQTNWGILDIIAAMKWSQVYAPLFGADPTQASMTGCSSGAEIIWRMITSPVVWPYIQRVNLMGMGTKGEYELDHAHKLTEAVWRSSGCTTVDCLRSSDSQVLADAGAAAYGARHPTQLFLEPGFGPVVDKKLFQKQLMLDIHDGAVKPHMPISWSYSEHDNWTFNHLQFANSLYKYLVPEIEEIRAARKQQGVKIPSPYSDLLLNRYFGPADTTKLLEVFGCPAGPNGEVVDCNNKFSKFVQSMTLVCNTRWALSGAFADAENFPDLGPVYTTQFGVRNCNPGSDGKNRFTCQCAEMPFVYGKTSLVSIDENVGKLFYDIEDPDKSDLIHRMRGAWGQFFRSGTFPDNTLTSWRDIGNYKDITNTINAPNFGWRLEHTFVEECKVLNEMNKYDDINSVVDYIVANTVAATESDNLVKDQFSEAVDHLQLAAFEAQKALDQAVKKIKKILAASLAEERSQQEGSGPAGSRPDGPRPEGSRPPGSRPPGSRPDGSRPEGSRQKESRPEGSRQEVEKDSVE